MANFIIAKILKETDELFGYRIYDSTAKECADLTVKETKDMIKASDAGSFGIMSCGIINADLNGDDIVVEGFQDKPIIIRPSGLLISSVNCIVCGFNPMSGKILIVDYNGNANEFSISKAKEFAETNGIENISNNKLINAAMKEKKKDEVVSVYKGTEKNIKIPEEYKENDLVNTLYSEVNISPANIIGAYILHTSMKTNSKNLRHYELDDDGNNIGKENEISYDIVDGIVDTFVLLQTKSKRFISIPVCEAFRPLIESFDICDIPVAKFKDFLDFITEENEDNLEFEDEKIISEILGGDIVSVKIDNTENVTYEIENGQPSLGYDKMDATFAVEIKEKKKTKDLVIYSFPWVIY